MWKTLSSPTFAILWRFMMRLPVKFCHCDLYRLRSIEELQDIGFADQMEKAAFVFIEWPELALPILEAFPHVNVYLTLTDANKRNIILEA
ncbi:MAG: tRNA (adenosine(37)-N6)-threonylcarbamoyltransferase complex ATPase subunit type 1 TsaE [Chitinophagales bacterium]